MKIRIRASIDASGHHPHNLAAMKYLNSVGYLCIPLAFVVHYLGEARHWEWGARLTFLLAGMGVIPLAHLMGHATEQLAEHTGPTLGGLLNATFGNAAEIIIGIIALSKGLNEIVQASLTGSILGNLLLVTGGAMVAGGWKREKQTFSRGAAEANSGLLALATGAMLLPAIFHYTVERMHDRKLLEHEEKVSLGTSFVLLAVYGLGLLFTLRTHKHLFSRAPSMSDEDKPGIVGMGGAWSIRKSLLALLGASAGIAIVAELLVGAAEKMAASLGWSEVFVGVILLAIIGNAAEHSTAILLAIRDDMDTAMTITFQSSIQIALFATPFLVLLSWGFHEFGVSPEHHQPLNLVFSPMEVAAVVLSVGIVILLCLNGESNWFEGVLLLGLYAILGIAFFYIPSHGEGAVQSIGPVSAPGLHP
jgi:Ca2+:H+ antiporter